MKLRLNVPFQDLAYRFAVSIATVSRIFSAWMVVIDAKLFPLVYWPERKQLYHTMPMCFQYAFGKKVTVIIDCFEVFIERPTNPLARAQTFSSYKHHNTIKILIGITPHRKLWIFRTFATRGYGDGRQGVHYYRECWPETSKVGYSGIHQRKIPTGPSWRGEKKGHSKCSHPCRKSDWTASAEVYYFRRYTAYWLSCM